MKSSIRISLFTLAALALTAVSYADGNVRQAGEGRMLVLVPNGHGQSTPLFIQPTPTSVALYRSAHRAGATSRTDEREMKAVSRQNAHGQTIIQFVR